MIKIGEKEKNDKYLRMEEVATKSSVLQLAYLIDIAFSKNRCFSLFDKYN
jgi:hypothetical protein